LEPIQVNCLVQEAAAADEIRRNFEVAELAREFGRCVEFTANAW